MNTILVTILAFAEPTLWKPPPAELEVCNLKAEICVLEAAPACGSEPENCKACADTYADCAYEFSKLWDLNCRVQYAKCKLWSCSEKPQPEYCAKVFATCPTL